LSAYVAADLAAIPFLRRAKIYVSYARVRGARCAACASCGQKI